MWDMIYLSFSYNKIGESRIKYLPGGDKFLIIY